MATRVYLIRHGATELSAEDRFAGSVDVLLSAEGKEQARKLGERLGEQPIVAIYASPMKRTIATAELGSISERRLEKLTHHSEGELALQLGSTGPKHAHPAHSGRCPCRGEQRRLPDPGRSFDHHEPATSSASLGERP